MKIKVCVTERDIAVGIRKSQLSCPIARAITRHLPKLKPFSRVSVGGQNVGFYQSNESTASTIAPLPVVAKRFVKTFDAIGTVAPFTFELNIPSK